jgi:hypothetical protein
MKNYLYILLMSGMIATASCADLAPEKLFSEKNAHVRFEFVSPSLSNPTPVNIPLDTFSVRNSAISALTIPLVLAKTSHTTATTVQLQVSSTAFPEGTYFMLTSAAGDPHLVVFPAGVFKQTIGFSPLQTFEGTGNIIFEIIQTNDPKIQLGFPGNPPLRKKFIIKVTN